MRHGFGLLAVRAAAVAGLAAIALLTQACSFSASSKGSSNSSESSSDSSASSSRSSSPESAESQYKSDVREYTAAYMRLGQGGATELQLKAYMDGLAGQEAAKRAAMQKGYDAKKK